MTVIATDGISAKVKGIEYTPPSYEVEHDAEVVYSEDFSSGLGGWESGWDYGYEEPTVSTAQAHSGTQSLHIVSDNSEGREDVWHALPWSSLVNGLQYTFSAWVYLVAGSTLILHTGNSRRTDVPSTTVTGQWVKLTLTRTYYTAEEGFVIRAEGTANQPVEFYLDEPTITQHAYTETVTDDPEPDLPLDVKDYRVSLDESRTPYGEVELRVATPAASYADQIDPRDGLRVEVTLTKDWGSGVEQSRTFDLLLHARTINARTGEMTLTCRTDEALLIDSMLGGTEVNGDAEDHQESLRDIIDNVLSDFDAELEDGDDDAAFLVVDNAPNIIANPSAEVDLTGWTARREGAVLTPTRETTSPPTGYTAYAHTVAGTSGIAYLDLRYGESSSGVTVPVIPGREYTLEVWYRTNRNDITARTYIQWTNEAGSIFSTSSDVHTTDTSASAGWVRYRTEPRTAPEGAVSVSFVFRVMEGVSTLTYATTIDIAGFQWVDSTVNPLKWTPGVRAWDFLSPLLQTAGLRLYCDEERKWYLVSAPHNIEGQVNLSNAVNLTEAEDTIDLGESDQGGSIGYAETVVVEYRWTDETGAQQVAYDAAGDSQGIGYHLVVNRPYPGSGAAQSLLNKAQGRGRTMRLAALSDLDTTPGMSVVATMPGTPVQVGRVASVLWLGNDEMEVGSRGLVDTPETAWALQPEGYAWDDVPTGESWDEYETPSS